MLLTFEIRKFTSKMYSQCIAVALPLFFYGGILLNLVFVSLIITTTEAPAMANGEINIDSLVRTLTESDTGSEEYKKAASDVKKLTDEQAGKVAQGIVQKVTGNDAQSVKTLLNIYEVGLVAGGNPLLDALGKIQSDATNKAFFNLVEVLRDPETAGGKSKLLTVLSKEPFSLEAEEAIKMIENLATQARKLKEAQKPVGKQLISSSHDTLSFDATTSVLSFTDDSIVGILNEDGTSDRNDSIIGAEVVIPDFTFNGINPEGEPGFENLSGGSIESIIIKKNSDIFLETVVPYLIWDGSQLVGFGGDLVLSGAPDGSAFGGGLPNLGSDYIGNLNSFLTPLDFKNFSTFRIVPDADLVQLTDNFTKSGDTGFTNVYAVTRPVPEPLTILGSLATIGFGAYAERKRKPSKSSKKDNTKAS